MAFTLPLCIRTYVLSSTVVICTLINISYLILSYLVTFEPFHFQTLTQLNNEVYHLKSKLAKYQQNDKVSQIQDLEKKFNKNLTKKKDEEIYCLKNHSQNLLKLVGQVNLN